MSYSIALPGIWAEVWLESVMVLLLVIGVRVLWRGASAATRHGFLLMALVSLPLLPLLDRLPSPGPRALWRLSGKSEPGNRISLSLAIAPARSTPRDGAVRPPEGSENHADSQEISGSDRWSIQLGSDVVAAACFVWMLGAGIGWLQLIWGQIRLRHLARAATPIEDGTWTTLLASCCQQLGLNRPVKLLYSRGDVMPLTWGALKPSVLLPSAAAAWPEARRRVVLLHEVAHIRRQDWLAKQVAGVLRAAFWLNPLVWLAERWMCLDRERACDDLVLQAGWRGSDYAGHLVEIARSFRHLPQGVGVAMARPTGLQRRVKAILDVGQNRNRIGKLAIGLCALLILSTTFLAGSYAGESSPGSWSLDRSAASAQLKRFVAEKKAQAEAGCRAEGKDFLPDYAKLFAAAGKGDWLTISNVFEDLRTRAPQYGHSPGSTNDDRLNGIAWEAVKEVWGAFYAFAVSGEKYSLVWSDRIINSIPPGSVYFGGTDPGRFLITAMAKSQIHADPFFILTQNAMANGPYPDYLRSMYGGKIYIPTAEDLQRCFQEYIQDASARLDHDEAFPNDERQVKPGENLSRGSDGKVQVSGQVAVMSINGLLTKLIFDHTTNREFFVEESFPLEWMYPHLEPHGLIMKIDRQEMKELPTRVVREDHVYWTKFVNQVLGDWLTQETTVQQIADFVNRVYVRHDLQGFTGDPDFVQNKDPQKMFGKLRVSIGGVYAWRVEHANGSGDKSRMVKEADFAYRQAWALCPDSPEAVFRYINYLIRQNRINDALVVSKAALSLDPHNEAINSLVKQLERLPPGR